MGDHLRKASHTNFHFLTLLTNKRAVSDQENFSNKIFFLDWQRTKEQSLTKLRRWRVLAANQSQGRVGQVKLCSPTPVAKREEVKKLSWKSFSDKIDIRFLSKLAKSQRPFFSLFGNVDESRGTGPSFSKERSKLAASKHLGWSMCPGKDPSASWK